MNWFKKFWTKLRAAPNPARVLLPRSAISPGAPVKPPELPDASKFTPHVQKALELARQEADRLNHNFVGTEHLFLGLMALGQGTAVKVLAHFGINLERVRAEVEKQVGKGPDEKWDGFTPVTPRVKKVIAIAAKEAKALNHTYVGTEHILLGLLCEGDGAGARVLKNLGLELDKTRNEILKELTPEIAAEQSASPEQCTASGEPTPAVAYSFTPRAQQALGFAHKEADRLLHTYIGTEHLLLGLTRLGSGVAANVLKTLGLDLETARAQVEKRMGIGAQEGLRDKLEYTLGVKRVFVQAAKDARDLNHTYVGTEHILLGLLAQEESVVAEIFKELGVDAEKVREDILRELAPAGPSPSDDTDLPPSASSGQMSSFTPRAQQVLGLAPQGSRPVQS